MIEPSFQIPDFTTAKVGFTILGALVLWCRWNINEGAGLRAFWVSALVDLLPTKNKTTRTLVELLLFLTLGSVVAILVLDPPTAKQALVAGCGWTGLISNAPQTGKRMPRKSSGGIST